MPKKWGKKKKKISSSSLENADADFEVRSIASSPFAHATKPSARGQRDSSQHARTPLSTRLCPFCAHSPPSRRRRCGCGRSWGRGRALCLIALPGKQWRAAASCCGKLCCVRVDTAPGPIRAARRPVSQISEPRARRRVRAQHMMYMPSFTPQGSREDTDRSFWSWDLQRPRRDARQVRIKVEPGEGVKLSPHAAMDPGLAPQWRHPVVGLPHGYTHRPLRRARWPGAGH